MPLPDFASHEIFPPFSSLPLTTTDTTTTTTPPSSTYLDSDHYLIAEISHNMTLTKPTLILTDVSHASFALVFDSRPGSGPDALDFAEIGYKRGRTLVVPRATRSAPKEGAEGKQGFVAVGREQEGDVRVVAGGLERVMRVGMWLRQRDEEGNGEGKRGCGSCGKGKEDGGLMKCTGCGEVEYCGKECQVKGWNEGHKGDCKVIKGIRTIWG
ncbi:hypothetical protein VTI74DRAFT_8798 [Chaetomium olivicolor]